MMAQRNITDRAKRYRAQNNVTGPRKCVLCGSRSDIQVMHLSGNENDGERANLAYGCRSCNGMLSSAFKRIGAGKRTAQYNPAAGVPTYEQYKWGVTHHNRGEHDEGGAIIHATPKHKRIQYAKMIAREAGPAKRETFAQRRRDFEDRYNPATRENLFGFGRGRDARRTTPASGGIAHHAALAAKRESKGSAASAGSHKGYKIGRTADGEYFSSLDPQSLFETKRGATALIDSYLKGRGNPRTRGNPSSAAEWIADFKRQGREIGTKDRRADSTGGAPYFKDHDELRRQAEYMADTAIQYRGVPAGKRGALVSAFTSAYSAAWRGKRSKRNPADASAKVFEEFHGYGPSEVVTVTKKVHFHSNLASLGKLVFLKLWGVDKVGHDLTGFKGAILASNEDRNQLFIEGGDQSIDLKDFGIRRGHELETLGKVLTVGYDTDKTHLGDEGGKAVYVHDFTTTNENGKHVKVPAARLPQLIYDVRNFQLLFSGGSYEILAEGINQ